MVDSPKSGASADLPPHPEDPVQENPFPRDHPGHQVWEKATRDAEQDLLRFKQKILEARPKNSEHDEELHIKLFVGTFEIWAKRGLSVVRDYAAARAFGQWLESYVQSTLKLIKEKDLPGIELTTFLPKFKRRLLRASHYWSANAMENATVLEAADAQNPTVHGESQPAADTSAEVDGEAQPNELREARTFSTWEEIEIRFLSDQRVQITAGGNSETRNYAEFGFEDGRTKNPKLAWVTLRLLAELGGTIQRAKTSREWAIVEKRIQEIRKVFRNHFGLSGDPLPFVEGTGYQARFKIGCAPSFES